MTYVAVIAVNVVIVYAFVIIAVIGYADIDAFTVVVIVFAVRYAAVDIVVAITYAVC